MVEHQNFTTMKEAQEHAQEMAEQMKRDFCKKHDFIVMQSGLTFHVTIVPRNR